MTVETFEKKYKALQKEGDEIYAQIKPLLNRLKSLSKKSMKLNDKVDHDTDLYDFFKRVEHDSEGKDVVYTSCCTKDWNTSIQFRLSDFDFLVNEHNAAIEVIDTVLYNLQHTPFRNGRRVNKHDK